MDKEKSLRIAKTALGFLVIAGFVGAYVVGTWRPHLAVLKIAQDRYDAYVFDKAEKDFTRCVNQNPDITSAGVSHAANNAYVAVEVAYTPHGVGEYFSDEEWANQADKVFGAAHRALFLCANQFFPGWMHVRLNYLNFALNESFKGEEYVTAQIGASVVFDWRVVDVALGTTKDTPRGNLAFITYLVDHIGSGVEVSPLPLFFTISVQADEMRNGDINLALERIKNSTENDSGGVYP